MRFSAERLPNRLLIGCQKEYQFVEALEQQYELTACREMDCISATKSKILGDDFSPPHNS